MRLGPNQSRLRCPVADAPHPAGHGPVRSSAGESPSVDSIVDLLDLLGLLFGDCRSSAQPCGGQNAPKIWNRAPCGSYWGRAHERTGSSRLPPSPPVVPAAGSGCFPPTGDHAWIGGSLVERPPSTLACPRRGAALVHSRSACAPTRRDGTARWCPSPATTLDLRAQCRSTSLLRQVTTSTALDDDSVGMRDAMMTDFYLLVTTLVQWPAQ
ncbi:hypothetical protein T310_2772 [Rasamsonia emersonii CBS 393.64]|uniref:Uncharacterized protein n=1 Tax=Rasamsonia emersonii (strain ATCC 16479 / CBS 393.64 / IMI 116815) TaxID=1408163 RepID=A0A0F4YY79_RASE3|nr:hypothetical protein T310_2772 [Rasamsonia emersonii CBS 393.64]KKA23179.1 hypothetical protein T310_2772 [Rasamsonia emersonii CBS 393.64]